MMLITIAIVVIFVLVILWTWHNLGKEDPIKKLLWIIVGLLISYGITFFLFQLSKSSIVYPNEEAMKQVTQIMVVLFTGLNSGISLPYLAKLWEEFQRDEWTRGEWIKKIGIFSVILLVLFFVEVNYMTSVQKGILTIYQKQVK